MNHTNSYQGTHKESSWNKRYQTYKGSFL